LVICLNCWGVRFFSYLWIFVSTFHISHHSPMLILLLLFIPLYLGGNPLLAYSSSIFWLLLQPPGPLHTPHLHLQSLFHRNHSSCFLMHWCFLPLIVLLYYALRKFHFLMSPKVYLSISVLPWGNCIVGQAGWSLILQMSQSCVLDLFSKIIRICNLS